MNRRHVWVAKAVGSLLGIALFAFLISVVTEGLRPPPALTESEQFTALVVERVDIPTSAVVSAGSGFFGTSDLIDFCTSAADPQPKSGKWGVRANEAGCWTVMSAETFERMEMSEADAEREAGIADLRRPVKYILGDEAEYRVSVNESAPHVLLATMPTEQANRLLRDPEFTLRVQDSLLDVSVAEEVDGFTALAFKRTDDQ